MTALINDLHEHLTNKAAGLDVTAFLGGIFQIISNVSRWSNASCKRSATTSFATTRTRTNNIKNINGRSGGI